MVGYRVRVSPPPPPWGSYDYIQRRHDNEFVLAFLTTRTTTLLRRPQCPDDRPVSHVVKTGCGTRSTLHTTAYVCSVPTRSRFSFVSGAEGAQTRSFDDHDYNSGITPHAQGRTVVVARGSPIDATRRLYILGAEIVRCNYTPFLD